MKNLSSFLIIISSFFALGSLNAQIVNIPDANFKAKLLAASSSNTIAKNLASSYFKIDADNDGEIQQSEAEQVSYLNINNVNNTNPVITSMEGILSFTNLQFLYCESNQITALNVFGLNNMLDLRCYGNQITSINVQGLSNLTYFNCGNNNITNLNVQGLTNLETFYCDNNNMNSLNVQGLTNLKNLWCRDGWLYTLNVGGCTSLLQILCSNNFISTLNVSSCINIQSLECQTNHLTSLNVTGCTKLNKIYCQQNQLTVLDFKECIALQELNCNQNQLTRLFIKNGKIEFPISFEYNPNLEFICCDANQITSIENKVNQYGYINCTVNSYCFFNPGGVYYTIQGQNTWDANNNGCDSNDGIYPYMKYFMTFGSISQYIIQNTTGNYSIPVGIGTLILNPLLENPAYFSISPATTSVTFPEQNSPYIQNFCIVPNGIHNDLEVVILPILRPRPGFNAIYKIIYKNKGNTTQSGNIALTFDGSASNLVSAIPAITNQATNTLSWDYSTLQPFETRTINLTLHVNSPTDTPPVNAGYQLNYVAVITPISGDEIPFDNTSLLKQIVVNSLDPNDKTCIEGSTITPDAVGQYVHYMIRFENDGTANAQNVVVKDMIDTNKFDVSSLIPITGSHSFETRITNTNQVEFIFENIDLPFTTGINDGYVAFKIKTKPTLILGNTFSNSANIYFDYNAPIVTNTATTTIAALITQDFDFSTFFSVYPNPAQSILNIETKATIGLNSINIYNVLGQIVLAITNTEVVSAIDVSGLKTGTYFIKVNTDKGMANIKFVKE